MTFSGFNKVVDSSAFRKSFTVDPIGTLSRAGVDVSVIPTEQLDIIAELSPSELQVLANISMRVKKIDPASLAGIEGGVIF